MATPTPQDIWAALTLQAQGRVPGRVVTGGIDPRALLAFQGPTPAPYDAAAQLAAQQAQNARIAKGSGMGVGAIAQPPPTQPVVSGMSTTTGLPAPPIQKNPAIDWTQVNPEVLGQLVQEPVARVMPYATVPANREADMNARVAPDASPVKGGAAQDTVGTAQARAATSADASAHMDKTPATHPAQEIAGYGADIMAGAAAGAKHPNFLTAFAHGWSGAAASGNERTDRKRAQVLEDERLKMAREEHAWRGEDRGYAAEDRARSRLREDRQLEEWEEDEEEEDESIEAKIQETMSKGWVPEGNRIAARNFVLSGNYDKKVAQEYSTTDRRTTSQKERDEVNADRVERGLKPYTPEEYNRVKNFKITDKKRADLEEGGASAVELTQLAATFKPEYSNHPFEGLTNMAGRLSPSASESEVEQADWWSRYQRVKNVTRNKLFGAALSATEKNEFEKADIKPGMNYETIQKNLARQEHAARSAARRIIEGMMAEGGNPDIIAAYLGMPVDEILATPYILPTEDKEGGAGATSYVRTATGANGKKMGQTADGKWHEIK